MKYRIRLWGLAFAMIALTNLSSIAFFQEYHDYIPGMEEFPDIDILRYNLKAEIRPDTTKVNVKAVVTFVMKEFKSDLVIFEMDRRSKISQAKDKEGNSLKFEKPDASDYFTVYLAEPIKQNERAEIILDYECDFPPLLNKKGGQETTKESSEGLYLFLRKWYPVNDFYCDQAPAEFTFTSPGNYEILTSGHEISFKIQEDRKTSHWRSFGSSNYYFVFAGPFIRYCYEDQLPKINIFMDTNEPYVAQAAKEKAREILQYFDELLCPYPYPVLYLVTTHSKMNPIGLNGLTYIDFTQFSQHYIYSDWTWSHELAHHWFGGIIQAETPEAYCLLMEGSAEYFSRLYIRSAKGDERFRIDLEAQRMAALSGNEITPITNYYKLKRGGEFLYAKGFYIYHMLRHIMGDEKFFQLMKNFIHEFYMKSAEIRNLEMLAERVYEQPLDWFFKQWIYGKGVPEYQLKFHINQKEDGKYDVAGSITQKFVKFRMPIEIVASADDRKYCHKSIVESNENLFQFELSFEPKSVLLDPDYNVLRWDKAIRVLIYTSTGRKLMRQKKFKEAEKFFDQALKMNPQCSWAALEKANSAISQDQYELAIQYYNQALTGDLDFHMMPWPHEQIIQVLHLWLGISHDVIGQRTEAISFYEKTIAMGRHPRFSSYYDKAKEYLKKPASIKK